MKAEDIDFENLGFNFIKTNSYFLSQYEEGSWDEGRLVPFEPLSISPATAILHYGQGIFEGMKAYQAETGDITLFRPYENAKRLNNSAERMAMPEYDTDSFVEAVKQVVKANEEFLPPYDTGGALYIRPLMFAREPMLGVRPADEYTFLVFTSPVGPYFQGGFETIDLKISKKYTRASPGGSGTAKTCCNYGPTIKPVQDVEQEGFDQLLFLDGQNMENIEEAGTANFFAVIDNKLVTPKIGSTILPGITRKSLLTLAEEKVGIETEERAIHYEELFSDTCTEAFCSGTAAVITPVGSVTVEGETRTYNDGEAGDLTKKLYDLLTGIQRLEIEDEFDWVMKVK